MPSAPQVTPPPLPPTPPVEEPPPRRSIPIPVDEDGDATEVVAAPVLAAARAASASYGEAARVDAAKVRAAVDEAMAPFQRTISELLRRIEELERRPQAAPVVVSALPPAALSAMRSQAPSHPGLESTGVVSVRAPAMSFHSLDVAAIERDTSIVVDDVLNGKTRRRRLVGALVVLLLVVFGILGFLLARSYAVR